MIKILHLITDLSTGGAEMMLYKLLSRMDNSRFQNVVVSLTDKGTLGGPIEDMVIPVFTLGMHRKLPNPMSLLRLLRILRKERPQILQTWLYHADLFGLLAGKFVHVPAIVWNLRCTDADSRHYSKLSAFIVYILAKLSAFPDTVLVNSKAGLQLHEALGYHPQRWLLVPNGFDLDQFRPNSEARIKLRLELDLPGDAFLIGLVARYDSMKDHATFLNAASLLVKDYPDIHFVLVGRGVDYNNSDLINIITSLGIEKNIHLLGERRNIPNITAALDIASSSSYGEGFPNVVGEAMACGVPCVVTDVGDSALLVGDTGRLVSPKNSYSLCEAWHELIKMGQDERRRLGIAARCRIRENFSLPSIVAQYEKLYEELSVR
ncbi:MAG: glycosyltransferase [Candidatus Methanoperedens sp.]|nr:glycosyltransferase [Candidatus Methanoperedens sp.]